MAISGCGGGGIANPTSPRSLAFAPVTNIPTGGGGSNSVVLADFNGDGKLDIAVSNFLSKTISVFLNNGDGTFQNPIISPINTPGLGVGPLSVGDFNEDGKPDLIASVFSVPSAAIVLLGNGNGTFRQLPSSSLAPPSPPATSLPASRTSTTMDTRILLPATTGASRSISERVMVRLPQRLLLCTRDRHAWWDQSAPNLSIWASLSVTSMATTNWISSLRIAPLMARLTYMQERWCSTPERETVRSKLPALYHSLLPFLSRLRAQTSTAMANPT
jgi:hypothetical protein